jgi:ketol-acid reductoisomerase
LTSEKPSKSAAVETSPLLQADLEALSGRSVAVIGYGNQGRAHALNLRDSGVLVAVGSDPGRAGWARSEADGFRPLPIEKAAASSDLVVLALPDEMHEGLWRDRLAASVRPGAVVGFLHGFSIHFGFVQVPQSMGVVLVAPKGPGHALRRRFEEGVGLPCLFAVHQGGADAAATRAIGLAWAAGIGGGRAAVVETTFAVEAETDLFGEQAVLCGGMMSLMQAAFDTLVRAGYPADVAYMECCQELKQIADLAYERGLAGTRTAISNTAEFGAFVAGDRLVDDTTRTKLDALLAEVRDGSFARRFRDDAQAGFPWMSRRRAAAAQERIERAGASVRRWMPWLGGREDTR